MLAKDIDDATNALSQSLPDIVRAGLDDELKKLRALYEVLTGAEEKNLLHQMRASLRWARVRFDKERDPAKRRKLEHEISEIENDVRREVERREKMK